MTPLEIPFEQVLKNALTFVDDLRKRADLAAMLGHSRIQMVLRYDHPTEEHQFAAMESVNGM